MDAARKTAIVVGGLFVLATVASLAATSLTAPSTSSNYLTQAAAHADQVKAGALLQLTAALAVVLIAAFLFPILRRYDEGIAAGYLGVRVVEAVILVVGAVGTLLLVTLSQAYVGAGSPPDPSYSTSGVVLQGIGTWAFVADPLIFGVGAVLFYYLLFRSRLVPLWLSGWGMAGAVLVFGAGLTGLFGSFQYALAVPIAVQEMALAGWLILRGFSLNGSGRPSATGFGEKPNLAVN
ncbi:MAG: DUF4386 domain-containing protein [Thermoplasmata archaeon]|nr:DUF4386 domain-containing protein [Thermoplasmata archaeon]